MRKGMHHRDFAGYCSPALFPQSGAGERSHAAAGLGRDA
jgi:hypothetical protein